jgi:hypothetical protein
LKKLLLIVVLAVCLVLPSNGLALEEHGNLAEDASFTLWWNTNGADGASITRATDGTVAVERDDGTNIAAGITDTEDNPATGVHRCVIDTSASADYATGHDYMVWVNGAVIDGVTVNAKIGVFSIENRLEDTIKLKVDRLTP